MLLGCDYLGPEMCTWLMVWEVRWLELKMFPKFPRTISCFWPVIYESGTENEREWGDYETKSYRFLETFVPSSHFQGWWTPLFSNPIQWLYFIFDWMICGKIRITSIIHNIDNNTLLVGTLIKHWTHLSSNAPIINQKGTNFSIVQRRNESGKASWMTHPILCVWMKGIKEETW